MNRRPGTAENQAPVHVIPLVQYAVMPVLTRATPGLLYPGRDPRPTRGAA